MKTKKERLIAICRVIKEHSVTSQEELKNLLDEEGFSFTQATLSRDMKLLKIIKYPDAKGNYIYVLPEENNYANNVKNVIDKKGLAYQVPNSVEFSGNLGIIKTRPGYAMAIASDIDNRATNEILGTIAGDDTILIIPREGMSREKIIDVLSVIIPNVMF